MKKFMFLMMLAGLRPNPAQAQSPVTDAPAAAPAIPDTDGDDVVVKGTKAATAKKKAGPEPICAIPEAAPKEVAECFVGLASYADREDCCLRLKDGYPECGIAVLIFTLEFDPEFPDLKAKDTKIDRVEQCLGDPNSDKISDNDRIVCCGRLQGGRQTQCEVAVKINARAILLMNRGDGCPEPDGGI